VSASTCYIAVLVVLCACVQKDRKPLETSWGALNRVPEDTVLFPLTLPLPLDTAKSQLSKLGFRPGEVEGHYRKWLGRPAGLYHNNADTLSAYRIEWRNEDSLAITILSHELDTRLRSNLGEPDSTWFYERSGGWGSLWRTDSILALWFYLHSSVYGEHRLNLTVHAQ
jgi:hypothetical protein